MTVSIGAATDYLYSLAQQAVSGVTVNGKPAVAIDGWPEELTFGMFVVGLSQPPPDGAAETVGTRELSTIGNVWSDEDYVVPCYIDVRISGTVQKTARDLAESIFNPFCAALIADRSLGGLLQLPGFAQLSSVIASPLNVGTVAEPGRRQFIGFGVHCRNLTA